MFTAFEAIVPPVDGRQSERAAAIQRGVGRLLRGRGFAIVYELPLATGRRADVVGLSPGGDIFIVEIKSSIEDFRVDRKWPEYRYSCDRLYFATHAEVPASIFPEDAGLILADAYGADFLREAPEHRLAAATRKAMLVRFASAAAHRLHGLVDPQAGEPGW
ncbi:MAG: MmcB family DNA repair protein [Alphaproteobacteria bacterium]|nr:MmcB family DNA repair protein [Alphaproteobacteria bacterium]